MAPRHRLTAPFHPGGASVYNPPANTLLLSKSRCVTQKNSSWLRVQTKKELSVKWLDFLKPTGGQSLDGLRIIFYGLIVD